MHGKMPKLPDFPPRLAEPPILPPASLARFSEAVTLPNNSILDRPAPILDPLAMHRKIISQKVGNGGSPSGLMGSLASNPNPSLYEMAALTSELDTQAVTTKCKEILLANNVGQKVRTESFNTVLCPF